MASLIYNHGSYYAVFSYGKNKKWIKIGKLDKKQARLILKQLEIEWAKDRLGLIEIKDISLFDFLDKYLAYCKPNKAESSYNRELEVIKPIKAYFGNITLGRIDSLAIEGYKAKRVADRRKPATINKELAVIRFMLGKAVEKDSAKGKAIEVT